MKNVVTPSYLPALLTGAFALGGVLLGLFFSSLEHVRERKMALRKEVYLQGAEAMANYQHYLAKFASVSLDGEEHRAMLDKTLPTFTKIHVVASMETIKQFDAVFLFLVENSYELGHLRYRRSQIESSIRDVDVEIEALKRSVEDIEDQAESPQETDSSSQVLGSGKNLNLSRLLGERSELADRWSRAHRILQEASSRADLEFREYLAQALLASRREMGLELPEREYMGMITKGSQRIRRALYKAMERRLKENN